MTTTNAYETLYNNMKTGLTVVRPDGEYTLGDFMLMRANEKKNAAIVSGKQSAENAGAFSAIFSYVNDKLTVKAPPAKDKTLRSFPLRTTISAVLSALVACTLVLSYGATVSRENDAAPKMKTEIVELDTSANELIIE